MAKNKGQAVAAPATSAPATEVKPTKIPRKTAEEMLRQGDITEDIFQKWEGQGRLTSGTGGGNPVADQLKAAGVPADLVEKLEESIESVNAALWKDAKTYIGNRVPHKSKKGVESAVMLEAALWVKHYADEEKSEESAS
ncbi:MAG: hypothetical protein ACREJC_09035 [Tepidisphaeraceae bacterium]